MKIVIQSGQLQNRIDELQLKDSDKFQNYYRTKVVPFIQPALTAGANPLRPLNGTAISGLALELAILSMWPGCFIHKDDISEAVDGGKDCQVRQLVPKGYHVLVNGEGNDEIGYAKRGYHTLVDGNISPRFTVRRKAILSDNDFDAVLAKRDNACWICRKKPGDIGDDGKQIKDLHRGHRHRNVELSARNAMAVCPYDNQYHSAHLGGPGCYDPNGRPIFTAHNCEERLARELRV